MTPTAAINIARQQVSSVYKCGSSPGGWGFNTWNEQRQAWWLPHGSEYSQAIQHRRAAIVEIAVTAMLQDAGIDQVFPMVDHGDSYLYRRIIDWVRVEYADALRYVNP